MILEMGRVLRPRLKEGIGDLGVVEVAEIVGAVSVVGFCFFKLYVL
jgi:hypothetical protein